MRLRIPIQWMGAVGLAACVAVITFLLLFPFQLLPKNHVTWLPEGEGLQVERPAMVYTRTAIQQAGDAPLPGLTIELWYFQPRRIKGGPRALVTLYDGPFEPPIIFGRIGNQHYLWTPGGSTEIAWWRQFLPSDRIGTNRDLFVAVTVDQRRKRMFVNHKLLEDRRMSASEAEALHIGGRLILGNSSGGNHGWSGIFRGLALYRRALEREEIELHRQQVEVSGIHALVGEPGLASLFPFDEGSGQVARNLVPGAPDLFLPGRFSGLPDSLLRLPRASLTREGATRIDAVQNVALFVPLGLLMALNLRRGPHPWRGALSLVAVGFAFSLSLELIQLMIASRTSSVADVVANTLGTALGAGIVTAYRSLRSRYRVRAA